MTKLLNILQEIKVIPSKVGQIAKDEQEIEQFIKDSNGNLGGLLTYLTPEMSYNELKTILGADASYKSRLSYDESDEKVSSEWFIKYGNPPKIGRIYDYKNDFAPFAEPDRPYSWHVGGDNDFKTEFLDKVGLKYANSWQDRLESFLDESLILEISEKVIKQKYEEYKKQNPNLDYEAVQYYVNRFDQIKSFRIVEETENHHFPNQVFKRQAIVKDNVLDLPLRVSIQLTIYVCELALTENLVISPRYFLLVDKSAFPNQLSFVHHLKE